MSKVDLVMPKMGESIMEATILKWVKSVGDSVEEDETILEIATDKVDSEIPSPVDGVIKEILYKEDDVVEVGKVIAIIETGSGENVESISVQSKQQDVSEPSPAVQAQPAENQKTINTIQSTEERFYSPLVKSIAKTENISNSELNEIKGTGSGGRVTKSDILTYVNNRNSAQPTIISTTAAAKSPETSSSISAPSVQKTTSLSGDVEIIEMGRMRKLIADHMVESVKTSPHVTSFVEADVTNLVNWRNSNKVAFKEKYGDKITFTPLIMEAVLQAMRDFPMINVSVDGDKIIKKNNINLGMATALPSGNLIVPVIKNADQLNLIGLAQRVNDLALRARNNKLKPDEIQGGTFTVTNVGTFGNVMGTPIINQPQVAIMAAGAIRKKPAVVETEYGDLIAVRQMMFLSLSYDHRVVDGFLGGSFLRKIADYLEAFDKNRAI